MRDKIKNIDYFTKQIQVYRDSIVQIEAMITTGKTKSDKINFMKRIIVGDYLNIINSMYSRGDEVIKIKDDIANAINITNESWDGFWKLKYEDKILNQYTLFGYDQMLWMLSLGYLLEIDNEQFKKLVDVIDRDKIKDYLFEFIIRAKMKERKLITKENYEYGWILFSKLRQAITETDKVKAEKLVKEFITKDWYKEHKDAGWYDNHKSKFDIYSGYWSFETAAVVKIMGLDDSSFIDCPYYPKDLVHQEK